MLNGMILQWQRWRYLRHQGKRLRAERSISCVSRAAEELDILTGTTGIVFRPRKLRSKSRTIVGIDEFYCHMSVFAEAEESAFRTKE